MGFRDFVKKQKGDNVIKTHKDYISYGFYRLSADGNIVRTETLYIENGEIIFSFDDKKLYIWKKEGKVDRSKPDVVLSKFDIAKIIVFLSEHGYL